jgi:hypothetical protein
MARLSFLRKIASVVLITLCCAATALGITKPLQSSAPATRHGPHFRFALFERSLSESSEAAATQQDESVKPPLPPSQFNPDPGGVTPAVDQGPIRLFPSEPVLPPDYGTEPLSKALALPRDHVEDVMPNQKTWQYRDYQAEGPIETPPNTKPFTNRWYVSFGHWKRYMDPSIETPYMYETPSLYHPYRQSILKGDVPIIGQDIFTNLTLKNFTLIEHRRLPTPSGISAAQPNSSEFFGRSEQSFFSNDVSVNLDIFKGETAFKPVDWDIRMMGVYNINYLAVRENNQVDADPRGVGYNEHDVQDPRKIGGGGVRSNDVNPQLTDSSIAKASELNPGDPVNFIESNLRNAGHGKYIDAGGATKDFQGTHYTTRLKDFFALQEAFGEVHLRDISDNYDFMSARVGIQPFVSDFRGFIFNDTNRGVRLFGNADDNRYQYNLIFFNMLEKDTYSDLNTFDPRDQYVLIANLFKQDFFSKGYTAQWSFHMNLDRGDEHFDKNDLMTRPELLGAVRRHNVDAFYFGWAGDGHIGRLNLTHALYQAFGKDEFNGLAGRPVLINAQMAALELSYDRDWIRFKLSGFYASGDHDPTDKWANGFDSIQDNPFFIGGPFSWYVHQGFNLAGTAVNLKQRDSLVPDLRSSKAEGQSNFVNPGAAILGVGSDLDVTSKLRGFCNVNYIWLAETKPIETALQTNKASNKLGLDCSVGFRYRPLLTSNIIMSLGVGMFFPSQGYRDIYRRNTDPVPGFGPQDRAGKVDPFLYNVFFTLTMTY